ncbi:MAG: hypothetical protein LBL45_13175 [Treponema sp.]|jgi:hypothetical protein|nr:hypothetical protein [Treponema sp.]
MEKYSLRGTRSHTSKRTHERTFRQFSHSSPWDITSKAKEERGLRRLVKRIGKVDGISFLLWRNAQAVILVIHGICWKAGYNPVCNGFLSAVYTGLKNSQTSVES